MSTNFEKISKLIRPHILNMTGYVSAGMQATKSDELIFLNANENPYVLGGMDGANRYPEPQPAALVEKMAGLYGVKNNQLLITRGADEGIALLFRLFCEADSDDIIINPPTFGVYKVYAGGVPCRNVHSIPLIRDNDTFKLDIAGIREALDNPANNVKMIFLTNPNNPTGNAFAAADIREVMNMTEGKAMVILDETYAEFLADCSLTSALEDTPHLIILRTLSKSFALAGMRVGAILSGVDELIDTLRSKVMEVYPIPVGSVKAALSVFEPENMKQAKENIQKLVTERARMEMFWSTQDQVKTVFQSDANFLLVEMERASAFCDYARENGVILRDFSNDALTPNALRISIGTPEQNDIVAKLAQDFYA